MDGLLDHARDIGALRHGTMVLPDKGLAGREMERYAADQVKVLLVCLDRKDEWPPYGDFGRMRQCIESVCDTAKKQLGLERHGGRTLAGVLAEIAQRLLAQAVAIWHNRTIQTPSQGYLSAYDHRTHWESLIYSSAERSHGWRTR